MKVVWLCHVANKELADIFGNPGIREFAPWITYLFDSFKTRNDIQLHLVIPNIYTNTDTYFLQQGVYIHCFSIGWHFLPWKVNLFMSYLIFFMNIRRKVLSIITNIKPDIVHLFGTENPQYSAGLLHLKGKFPVLVTIQGFATVFHPRWYEYVVLMKIFVEKRILQSFDDFGSRTEFMQHQIRKYNPNARFHPHQIPITIPEIRRNSSMENATYDCLYFARICKEKGIEDLIAAIALLKASGMEISCLVIGAGTPSYTSYIYRRIKKLDLTNQIIFLGFIPTQEDAYQESLKARICVLPTYYDIIPGTVIESMFIGIPVISYAVGGLPELNNLRESVVLVPKKDISALAQEISNLKEDDHRRTFLARNALQTASELFHNEDIESHIIKAYQSVYQKYHGSEFRD